MKKILVLLLSSLFFIFQSCDKHETEIYINEKGNTKTDAELVVKILSSDVKTKAIGYGDNDYVETKISNAVIGTFFEDGKINVIRNASFNEGAETKMTISLKSGKSRVYVVANVNPDLFSTVNTELEFKSVVLSLSQTVIPMTGNKSIDILPNATTKETLEIERMVSKISLSKINIGFANNGYANTTYSIDKVFLHNVNTKSSINYVTSNPKSGLTESSLLNLKESFFDPFDRHYFYGFESKLRLVVGGWFKEGNRAAEYIYYPVDIDAKHNTHYAIMMTLNGKGVSNPDDKFEASGKLDLTIKVIDWELENLNPIFD